MVSFINVLVDMIVMTRYDLLVRGSVGRLELDDTEESEGDVQPDSDRDVDIVMMVKGKGI